MNKEQYELVIDSLVNFVARVSKGTTRETETAVLPQVVQALIAMYSITPR